MKTAFPRLSLALIASLTLLMAVPTTAQDRGEREDRGGDRERSERDERNNWRERWANASEEEREKMREEMRQRWAEREAERNKQRSEQLRERLGMSEEDFEAITPLIDKVRSAVRDRDMATRSSRGGFGRGPSGEQSEHVKNATEAMSELREAIADDNSGDIKDALAKLRKARTALNKNLSDAREELRSICTAKWEAEFVVMGLLD